MAVSGQNQLDRSEAIEDSADLVKMRILCHLIKQKFICLAIKDHVGKRP
jgi:hypothetical protein